jgi:hypothetical protein
MNLIKLNYLLYKARVQKAKEASIAKHMTKMYYKTLDIAIKRCITEPRKYYIVKKSESEWEILGSQEVRKMRRFKEAKHDENFMKLEEMSPFVSPVNIQRHIHEQTRRKYRWWFLFSENYYKPVTEGELEMLKQVGRKMSTLFYRGSDNSESALAEFIKKHE